MRSLTRITQHGTAHTAQHTQQKQHSTHSTSSSRRHVHQALPCIRAHAPNHALDLSAGPQLKQHLTAAGCIARNPRPSTAHPSSSRRSRGQGQQRGLPLHRLNQLPRQQRADGGWVRWERGGSDVGEDGEAGGGDLSGGLVFWGCMRETGVVMDRYVWDRWMAGGRSKARRIVALTGPESRAVRGSRYHAPLPTRVQPPKLHARAPSASAVAEQYQWNAAAALSVNQCKTNSHCCSLNTHQPDATSQFKPNQTKPQLHTPCGRRR